MCEGNGPCPENSNSLNHRSKPYGEARVRIMAQRISSLRILFQLIYFVRHYKAPCYNQSTLTNMQPHNAPITRPPAWLSVNDMMCIEGRVHAVVRFAAWVTYPPGYHDVSFLLQWESGRTWRTLLQATSEAKAKCGYHQAFLECICFPNTAWEQRKAAGTASGGLCRYLSPHWTIFVTFC